MANFSKSHVPQFSVEVYQNEYLPEGAATSTRSSRSRRPVAAPPVASC